MGIRLCNSVSKRGVATCNCIKNVKHSCYRCKTLVVGGGTGGCSVAWRLSKRLTNIIVLEPSQDHYYQPMFTLIGAGLRKFQQSHRKTEEILPHRVTWLKDYAEDFDPSNNVVYTRYGNRIYYDFLVVAVGLKNDYHKIPGLQQSLADPTRPVATIYSHEFCQKTWCCIQRHKGGHVLFTFPKEGVKCSGAAQKIMYLADHYFRKNNLRDLTSITYNTGGTALFGIPKYASALNRVISDRQISVNCNMELVEVTKKAAAFLDAGGQLVSFPYTLLHVTPPMSSPLCLSRSIELVDVAGYLYVDPHTLQHNTYPNVFGIGDCISTTNSKTAAAIACQSAVVADNLYDTTIGRRPTAKYNGYGSCPIYTSYGTAIMAEFGYDKKPLETFAFDQSKERRSLYYLHTYLLPYLYWNRLLNGKWSGPTTWRKFFNPFGW